MKNVLCFVTHVDVVGIATCNWFKKHYLIRFMYLYIYSSNLKVMQGKQVNEIIFNQFG